MALFSLIFFKIISILLNIIIGFLAGRFTKIESNSIGTLLFYFIAPIVFFSVPIQAPINASSIYITVVTFGLASLLAIISYYLFNLYWNNETSNILSSISSSVNVGYFMFPIASTIFDDYNLSIYMMAVVGINIYEASVGYYIYARGFESPLTGIKKLLTLPTLIAFTLGCAFSFLELELPDFLDDLIYNMRNIYSVLGMIMLGISLSGIKNFTIDSKFILSACVARFILYPIIINLFILLDKFILNWGNESWYYALQLIAIAPMATNSILLTGIFKFPSEKVATTILVSLLIALLYIPLVSSLLFQDLE